MVTRRNFIKQGLGGAALGILAHKGLVLPAGALPCGLSGEPLEGAGPFLCLPEPLESVMVKGMPFAEWFTGDDFHNDDIPFHGNEFCFANGEPPAPTEEIDVAVIGGGISGLTTAYLLRGHKPVLFEMRERFGGVAAGERWAGTPYSLGNAYVITPDHGSFLESFYHQLKLHQQVRVDDGDFMVELGGQILDGIFKPNRRNPQEIEALQRYCDIVMDMGYNRYPDIPLLDGVDNQWILDLDKKTLRQDIEEQMGMPVPTALASAIQAYCYSSFAAGWEEISAASGWNFLAAEEFGRWVFPGATTFMVHQLWDKLHKLDQAGPPHRPPRLRSGTRVVDVRLVPGGRVQVTYTTGTGDCASLLAKKVVMACPKLVCKTMIHLLSKIDEPKIAAMERLEYRGYVVANVLLDAEIACDFYDIFLLGDGQLPMDEQQTQANSRITDVLSGHFARRDDVPRSVLTLYWPLPFDFGRWTLFINSVWEDYAGAMVPQIHAMLETLGVSPSAVKQVRLTRWGHAMPIARPGLIADGTTTHLRRPIDDKIFFVNQDNWALPAVENCVLDAEIFLPDIRSGL